MVENPDYDGEKEAYEKASIREYGYSTARPDLIRPQRFIEGQCLSSVVTELQFKAMQKALIETFGVEQDENAELPFQEPNVDC